jgi:dolichol-phosphate mannosyltransferase
MKKIHVITPVFNEEENIENLLIGWNLLINSLPQFDFHFYLVDDGSTDQTCNELETRKGKLQINVLKHPVNKGPGEAFATGFAHLAKVMKPNELVVTMEGDNTSRIETLMRMISRLENENLDVVLASPFTYGGYIKTDKSLLRTFISTIANSLIKLVLGIRGIHTFSSFFRVYRTEAISDLQKSFGDRIIYVTGFEGIVELLAKIIYLQQSLSEVPLQLDWSLRKGKSKLKIVRTSLGYFRLFYILKTKPKPYGLN